MTIGSRLGRVTRGTLDGAFAQAVLLSVASSALGCTVGQEIKALLIRLILGIEIDSGTCRARRAEPIRSGLGRVASRAQYGTLTEGILGFVARLAGSISRGLNIKTLLALWTFRIETDGAA